MSDEFIRVATKEIEEELNGISSILQTCGEDLDVTQNSVKIEKHMHKIKGLAPMMGKENIGELAKISDSILKHMMTGKKIDGILELLSASVEQMKIAINASYDLSKIQKRLSDLYLKINN